MITLMVHRVKAEADSTHVVGRVAGNGPTVPDGRIRAKRKKPGLFAAAFDGSRAAKTVGVPICGSGHELANAGVSAGGGTPQLPIRPWAPLAAPPWSCKQYCRPLTASGTSTLTLEGGHTPIGPPF